jgi:hypothetical protein
VDVLIDSAGILAGSLLYLAVRRILKNRGEKETGEAAGNQAGTDA